MLWPVLGGIAAWVGIDNVVVPSFGDSKIRERIHAAYKAAIDGDPETKVRDELGAAFDRLTKHWSREKERLENPEGTPGRERSPGTPQLEEDEDGSGFTDFFREAWDKNKVPLIGGGAVGTAWLMSKNPLIRKVTGWMFVTALIVVGGSHILRNVFNKEANRPVLASQQDLERNPNVVTTRSSGVPTGLKVGPGEPEPEVA